MSDERLDHHLCQGCNAEFTEDQLKKAILAKEMPFIEKDITNAIGDDPSKWHQEDIQMIRSDNHGN